ncbi:MAG: IgGFc-binding protein [Myxococcales bacterium]|nr:IgGFc-binding protein [Myxococcales bacterium]
MRLLSFGLLALPLLACSAGADDLGGGGQGAGDTATSGTGSNTTGQGGSTGTFMGTGGNNTCGGSCSPDLHQVLDCNGSVVKECTGSEACNPLTLQCTNACQAAADTKQSVGCEYYAVDMEQYTPDSCFAAYVANTWNTPVKIQVEFAGQTLDPAQFARVPQGQGPTLSYQPYDAVNGLPPGQVAILFLSGGSFSSVPCPVTPARDPSAGLTGTGIGSAFRITTDVPVVSYQMNPYGGGSAAVTAASLLLPTSAWDTNYVAVNVTPYDIAAPSMNVIAYQDQTTVTMLPNQPVQGGGGIPSGQANTPLSFVLNKGQQAQITQTAELTGSVIQSDKPIGFLAGQPCMRWPTGVAYCDHGEQMVPPVRALGSEYVGVMHRPRAAEPAYWRIVGAVDGTQLTYSTNVGGPATINLGQQVVFPSSTPFVVKSQDENHPFMLFSYMTGSQAAADGYGDPDMVINVPVPQYMSSYVFFADPSYPETNLVIVRSKLNGTFRDVNLDCLGVVGGWQPVGDYEWTRVDLMTGNFQQVGNCSTGRHEITSEGPFGLWVWGWGTPLTSSFTANVSYGYPAGMNVIPINDVIIPPDPR